MQQLHLNSIPYANTLGALDQFAFHRWAENPDPSAFLRSPGDNGLESLADS
jgi:hypothetical protein